LNTSNTRHLNEKLYLVEVPFCCLRLSAEFETQVTKSQVVNPSAFQLPNRGSAGRTLVSCQSNFGGYLLSRDQVNLEGIAATNSAVLRVFVLTKVLS